MLVHVPGEADREETRSRLSTLQTSAEFPCSGHTLRLSSLPLGPAPAPRFSSDPLSAAVVARGSLWLSWLREGICLFLGHTHGLLNLLALSSFTLRAPLRCLWLPCLSLFCSPAVQPALLPVVLKQLQEPRFGSSGPLKSVTAPSVALNSAKV